MVRDLTEEKLRDAARAPERRPRLQGKRAAMATFSAYPGDPRPRRAIEALLAEGMAVELICLADGEQPAREKGDRLRVFRVPLAHTRGGKIRYAFNYVAFLLSAALLMTLRLAGGRFHLVYIHNMPDVLVFSALVPRLLGARVILDQHDPMPELMTTIYEVGPDSWSVRVLKFLEKLSLGFADRVITVNAACRRIFGDRSCSPEKITVVMNSPDETIFPFRPLEEGQESGAKRPFVLMYHGSLVERNGLDLAVEAVARLGVPADALELRVFGRETPYLHRVLAQARQLGVEGYVRYLGPRRLEDLPAEIAACDAGVIPNQRNAFTDINTPTRIFEYLSVGKPVIAPRTPGVLDYFSADSLVFFESGRSDDLAEKMRFVMQHPAQARATARLGQQVLAQHTWSQERETLIETVAALILPKASA
jgi:glycosyltransferase involved in cell wall biosynthesis